MAEAQFSSHTVEPVPYVQPKRHGKVPEVVPGTSGGKVIEGDFPLDQIVIDRNVFPCLTHDYSPKKSSNF
jgi:hypothetical protein